MLLFQNIFLIQKFLRGISHEQNVPTKTNIAIVVHWSVFVFCVHGRVDILYFQ